jgi:hypothetical protein
VKRPEPSPPHIPVSLKRTHSQRPTATCPAQHLVLPTFYEGGALCATTDEARAPASARSVHLGRTLRSATDDDARSSLAHTALCDTVSDPRKTTRACTTPLSPAVHLHSLFLLPRGGVFRTLAGCVAALVRLTPCGSFRGGAPKRNQYNNGSEVRGAELEHFLRSAPCCEKNCFPVYQHNPVKGKGSDLTRR